MEFLLPFMENRKRSANVLNSDDEQSDIADNEVSEILEANDSETQTPILENDYMPDGDTTLDNIGKEPEDSVEKSIDPSSTGKKITFKKPLKKMKKKII